MATKRESGNARAGGSEGERDASASVRSVAWRRVAVSVHEHRGDGFPFAAEALCI